MNVKLLAALAEAREQRARDATKSLELRVGHDGSGDLRVIVDAALQENPDITIDELVEIVHEARLDAAAERARDQ